MAMFDIRASALRSFADVIRLPSGQKLIVRFVEPEDVESLQAYLHALSRPSHYNRFLGAVRALSGKELDRIVRIGEERRFAVIAELQVDGRPLIVGEARYAFDPTWRQVEFGMSIGEAWRRRGMGSALIANLECRAAASGAVNLFGEALRTNEAMIALARKAGFSLKHAPDDWRLSRFEKKLGSAVNEIPCPGSRRVAAALAAAG
jgi:RimJ/RimL family protein N-acetyltransferase